MLQRMSWRDFFKSNLVHSLENEVAYLRSQLAEQKTAYAAEISRVITHNERLAEELQRTRVLLSPGLQGITLPHEIEDDASEAKEVISFATPWQREEARLHAEDAKRTALRKTAAAQGASDGNVRSTGAAPPLSESSKAS